jgi:hypothetical protein
LIFFTLVRLAKVKPKMTEDEIKDFKEYLLQAKRSFHSIEDTCEFVGRDMVEFVLKKLRDVKQKLLKFVKDDQNKHDLATFAYNFDNIDRDIGRLERCIAKFDNKNLTTSAPAGAPARSAAAVSAGAFAGILARSAASASAGAPFEQKGQASSPAKSRFNEEMALAMQKSIETAKKSTGTVQVYYPHWFTSKILSVHGLVHLPDENNDKHPALVIGQPKGVAPLIHFACALVTCMNASLQETKYECNFAFTDTGINLNHEIATDVLHPCENVEVQSNISNFGDIVDIVRKTLEKSGFNSEDEVFGVQLVLYEQNGKGDVSLNQVENLGKSPKWSLAIILQQGRYYNWCLTPGEYAALSGTAREGMHVRKDAPARNPRADRHVTFAGNVQANPRSNAQDVPQAARSNAQAFSQVNTEANTPIAEWNLQSNAYLIPRLNSQVGQSQAVPQANTRSNAQAVPQANTRSNTQVGPQVNPRLNAQAVPQANRGSNAQIIAGYGVPNNSAIPEMNSQPNNSAIPGVTQRRLPPEYFRTY